MENTRNASNRVFRDINRRRWISYLNPRRLTIPIPAFRRYRSLILGCIIAGVVLGICALVMRIIVSDNKWPGSSTLVFSKDELRRIWSWEIQSGHYPSRRKLPKAMEFTTVIPNPALPRILPSRYDPPQKFKTSTLAIGPERVYHNFSPPHFGHPIRPISGSVIDLDVVMEHCDYSENKYVRDCLEVLRVGGGLDGGNRLRQGIPDNWKYLYTEQPRAPADSSKDGTNLEPSSTPNRMWEPPLTLRSPPHHTPYSSLSPSGPCDDENPRIFHIFWTGPFTDKPYMAALSFLFTQNVGLHSIANTQNVCRPRFWIWINPGPAAASTSSLTALEDMYEGLKANQWAAPLLHPRFKEVIQFKLWNTTERLDAIPELKNDWRAARALLSSRGNHYNKVQKVALARNHTSKAQDRDDLYNRQGSKSADTYDKLTVVLSDMVRFVLCPQFGGIYLDADTILLRDWEELWGWTGAFAYRWSRLPEYNTAVLRMHRQSALGSFLFRTALKNGLDFHPFTLWQYVKDASIEGLLLRLPDALFDPAWLNLEGYLADRPVEPYFHDFVEFFQTPKQTNPSALGIDGFFKGAYSYHWHNFYWLPMDPSRDYPDLGHRFSKQKGHETDPLDLRYELGDERDLGWSAVFKRTYESYLRGERPNLYGETIDW